MPELNLPIPEVTPGPEWASQLNEAITTINDEIETGRLSETELNAARDLALAGQFAGANLQTTTDLNSVTTPGVYRQSTATDLRALNYPNVSSLGVLRVYTTTNTILQEFTVTTDALQAARGMYMRRMIVSTGSWTAWSFIASQRVDQTAGRAIYIWDDLNNREQLIYGDTGQRSLSSLLSSVWDTSGGSTLHVRRSTYEVYWSFSLRPLVDIPETTVTDILAGGVTLPGFGNIDDGWYGDRQLPAITSAATQPWFFNRQSGSARPQIYAEFGPIPAGTWLRGLLAHNTRDIWPTTLPGNAISTIPNA